MSNFDIIRAWKDEDYRNSLTEDQKSQLPENPAGMIDLSDEQMTSISGGESFVFTKALSCWSPDCSFRDPSTTTLRQDC
jgi:mersacidin/lichenicidin family type 2 lantibiotic